MNLPLHLPSPHTQLFTYKPQSQRCVLGRVVGDGVHHEQPEAPVLVHCKEAMRGGDPGGPADRRAVQQVTVQRGNQIPGEMWGGR